MTGGKKQTSKVTLFSGGDAFWFRFKLISSFAATIISRKSHFEYTIYYFTLTLTNMLCSFPYLGMAPVSCDGCVWGWMDSFTSWPQNATSEHLNTIVWRFTHQNPTIADNYCTKTSLWMKNTICNHSSQKRFYLNTTRIFSWQKQQLYCVC